MQEYMTLGQAPPEETPAQVGEPDYRTNALRECQAYVQALRNVLGPEPAGARLGSKGFAHDFGTYYEVVCYFDPAVPEALDYALRCEREGPATWEEGGVNPPPRAGYERGGSSPW